MLADQIDDWRLRFARVVQIRRAVRKSRPEMQQRASWLSGHPRISVRGAGHHAFEQPEHATHFAHAVERRDNMHFRRAGVGEASVHSARHQRANQAFCTVHEFDLKDYLGMESFIEVPRNHGAELVRIFRDHSEMVAGNSFAIELFDQADQTATAFAGKSVSTAALTNLTFPG